MNTQSLAPSSRRARSVVLIAGIVAGIGAILLVGAFLHPDRSEVPGASSRAFSAPMPHPATALDEVQAGRMTFETAAAQMEQTAVGATGPGGASLDALHLAATALASAGRVYLGILTKTAPLAADAHGWAVEESATRTVIHWSDVASTAPSVKAWETDMAHVEAAAETIADEVLRD